MARRHKFSVSRKLENEYGRKLRTIAEHIYKLVKDNTDDSDMDIDAIVTALSKYADKIENWAKLSAELIAKRVSANSRRDWMQLSKSLTRQYKYALKHDRSDIYAARQWVDEQSQLIRSLSTEAAERAQEIAFTAATEGVRASDIADDIMKLGSITKNRATLIARTEVARANAKINQAKAQAAGIRQYVWRTMEDEDVRLSHKKLDGMVFSYDDPPEIPNEGRHGPGEFCNCRCYAEPVIPEEYLA